MGFVDCVSSWNIFLSDIEQDLAVHIVCFIDNINIENWKGTGCSINLSL